MTGERVRGLRYVSAVLALAFILVLLFPLMMPAQDSKGPKAGGEQADNKKEEGLRLRPARKICFDTEEDTWMSLRVSPDGTQIVLELFGDLYVVLVIGSDAKDLTLGKAWDCQPLFSPDAEQIEFISDRDGSDNFAVGSTEPSKLHDLLVLNSIPVENIHNSNGICYVIKSAETFDASTLNEV